MSGGLITTDTEQFTWVITQVAALVIDTTALQRSLCNLQQNELYCVQNLQTHTHTHNEQFITQ